MARQDAGTTLIGRLSIAGAGGTCCVVADPVRPDMDGLPPLELTAEEAKALRAANTFTSQRWQWRTTRMERFC